MQAYHLFERWMSEARADLSNLELFDIYLPVVPIGKERARNHRTAIKTRTWTDYVGVCVAEEMYDKPTISFPCAIRLITGISGKRTPDTDNMEKAIWDALQRGDKEGNGRVYTDDKLIRGYVEKCERVVPKGDEFFWVRLYARNRGDFALWHLEATTMEANKNGCGY
jgi:Holliday junction resolvase RusA-like endonuclease